jgi:hypothetical protein
MVSRINQPRAEAFGVEMVRSRRDTQLKIVEVKHWDAFVKRLRQQKG